ncbi:MazG nucleotide pyrophosphohydrolase domain-containing protein [Micromonospora sp. NPDC023966]|uniref:MazG nucleotide pyrophosphohydrolase domain-containing protein n=1 Tax=Micromonospora sp. NPDC023966 TaxID=3154699 RepID=UPI0033FFF53A
MTPERRDGPASGTGDSLATEAVVAALRESCPFNRRQRPRDLVAALEAEVRELAAAIDEGSLRDIRSELGDVLFTVVSLAAAYADVGAFDLADVDRASAEKMIRRHPYVFAGEPDPGPAEAARQWAEQKEAEERDRLADRAGVGLILHAHGVPEVTSGVLLRTATALLGPGVSSVAGAEQKADHPYAAAPGSAGPPAQLRLEFPAPLIAPDTAAPIVHIAAASNPDAIAVAYGHSEHGFAAIAAFTSDNPDPVRLRADAGKILATDRVEVFLTEVQHAR